MNWGKLIKIGFGKVEAVKSAKSAGVAGVGGIAFALIGDLLPAPFADPVVGIPVLTWAINSLRKLVTNNDPAE
jgi:hypothetical protein